MGMLLDILGKAKKPDGAEASEDEGTPGHLAAQGLLSAIEDKDAVAVLAAFRELMACCKEESEEAGEM